MAEPTALELETLTYTLLGEARGEGVDGMSMVANVIRNRAESGLYSSNPVDVVLQDYQFSTYNDASRGGNQDATRAEVPPGSALYQQAEEIVRTVIYGDNRVDQTGGSLFYHSAAVAPSWAGAVTTQYGTIQQGRHVFYPRNPIPPRDIPRSLDNLGKTAARPAASGPAIIDITAGGKLPDGKPIRSSPFGGGKPKERTEDIMGVVFHHTGPGPLIGHLNYAGATGAQYYIDTDGQIYQYASDNIYVVGIRPPGSLNRTDVGTATELLSNQNTINIEIVAADEDAVTDAQKEAAAALSYYLANKYSIPPELIVGHGQLQGGTPQKGADPRGMRRPLEGMMPAEYSRSFITEGKTPPALAAIEGSLGGDASAAGWKNKGAVDYTNQSSEGMWRKFRNPPIVENVTGIPTQVVDFDAAAIGLNARGTGGLFGNQDELIYRSVNSAFDGGLEITPTINQALDFEAHGIPAQYFSFDFMVPRDPIGVHDRGVGSVIAPSQDSAERRIAEARREQQYQQIRTAQVEASRDLIERNDDIGTEIEAVGGFEIPSSEGDLRAPAVTKADLFGPAFAPQQLTRPLTAPGEGLTDDQHRALREVPQPAPIAPSSLVWPPPSEIVVATTRPEVIGSDGRMIGSPNNNFNTPLSAAEETIYRVWKAARAPEDSGEDYDYRGAYRAGVEPDENGHWPDTFKKPNHPTFSVESQYAPFSPGRAGHWEGEVFVPAFTGKPQPDEPGIPKAVRDQIAREQQRQREITDGIRPEQPGRVVNDRPVAFVDDFLTAVSRETNLTPEQRITQAKTAVQSDKTVAGSTAGIKRVGSSDTRSLSKPGAVATSAPGAGLTTKQKQAIRDVPAGGGLSAPGAGLTEAQKRAIREVTPAPASVSPSKPPTIPKLISLPPQVPPQITRIAPIGVGGVQVIPQPSAQVQRVTGVVADVVKRISSVGSTLKTLGNAVVGETRRVTGAPPLNPPTPQPRPSTTAAPKAAPAVPAAATTTVAPKLTTPKPLGAALEVEVAKSKPGRVSTSTVQPINRTGKNISSKPATPAVKQPDAPVKADKQAKNAAKAPQTPVKTTVTPRRVVTAPSTVVQRPRTTVVAPPGVTAPLVRTLDGQTGQVRTVVMAPNGGVVTQGKSGPLNSITQASAYWQMIRGEIGSNDNINSGISGDGRTGGPASLV